MKKRFWLISEFYFPDENSTGHLLTQIAEGLAQTEEVHILCGRCVDRKSVTEKAVSIRNNVFIERVNSSGFNKDILLLRLINIISLSIRIFFRLLLNLHRDDNVLVVTNPPALPFMAALACWMKHTVYSVLMFDLYPDVLVATKILSEKNPFTIILRWMTNILFRYSQHIIVLGRDMSHRLSKKYSGTRDRIIVIPNWGDIDIITPQNIDQNTILKELSINDKFIVQYVGNIGRTHNVELLLECAELLKDKTDICFLFIGDGAKKKWLTESVKKRNFSNVIIRTYYSRERQSDVHNACDIAVVSFIPAMAGISVPSRIYNIMAAGKPILAIADPESELTTVVQEENIGWVVTSYQAQDVVDVILSAMKNRTALLEMGKRARRATEEKYYFKRIIALYRNVLLNTMKD
ncbi:MAG: glycosyltransferase family 4 protein [Bacteroidota bacterium]